MDVMLLLPPPPPPPPLLLLLLLLPLMLLLLYWTYKHCCRNRQPKKIDQKLGFSPALPAGRCLAAPLLEG